MQDILHPYCAAEKNLNLHLDQPKPRHRKKSVMMGTVAEWISYPSTRNNFWPFKTDLGLFFNALPLFFKHEWLIWGYFEKQAWKQWFLILKIHVFPTLQFHLFI